MTYAYCLSSETGGFYVCLWISGGQQDAWWLTFQAKEVWFLQAHLISDGTDQYEQGLESLWRVFQENVAFLVGSIWSKDIYCIVLGKYYCVHHSTRFYFFYLAIVKLYFQKVRAMYPPSAWVIFSAAEARDIDIHGLKMGRQLGDQKERLTVLFVIPALLGTCERRY